MERPEDQAMGPAPVTLALAGDTMLGRGVAERLLASPRLETIFSDEVRLVLAGADLVVLNLECCISERGKRWPDPGKPYFFRAPPVAAELLADLGVDCVNLANNHALDYGFDALGDTRALLAGAGVRAVGAGCEMEQARQFAVLEARGLRLAVIGVTDHPEDWAAGDDRPGVARADLGSGVPDWLSSLITRAAAEADAVLITPHWGPNLTSRPPDYVRVAAQQLSDAGATLVAGHSAHVFHGVAERIIFDMGDFVDDYAVYPYLRNDLGLLFLVTLDSHGPAPLMPIRLEAVPLAIDHCRTRLADDVEWEWIRDRFVDACAELGTAVQVQVQVQGKRLVVDWS
jgi:poly-gamma-glutamate capsule biosynthesis protein CapA/YwtB (metallophosphatase superfamily)